MITLQIVVAGLLLLAWVAVLGRPAPGPAGDASDDLDADTSDDGRPSRPELTGTRPWALPFELPELLRPRSDDSVTQRRRQRLLATMFATFAAFFLAVAFHGTFVALFVVMLVALTVHLGIAARIGGRMVAERRAARLAAAKDAARRRARAQPGLFLGAGPVIGAGRACDLSGAATAGAPAGPESDPSRRSSPGGATGGGRSSDGNGSDAGTGGSEDRPVGSGDGEPDDADEDPFDRAAAMASALGPDEGVPPIPPEQMVSDLIDQAWAEPEPEPEVEEPSVADDGSTDEVSDGGTRIGGRLFTRPLAGTRSRLRRSKGREKRRGRSKAKPIHIESQLDGELPTAVNDH